MKYITSFYQHGWNFVLTDVLNQKFEPVLLKCNSFEYKVYAHKDDTLLIVGDTKRVLKQDICRMFEYLDQEVSKVKPLFIDSGIMGIIAKNLHNDNMLYNIYGEDKYTTINKQYYESIYNGDNGYISFMGALAYNTEKDYTGWFRNGFVKNFGKPTEIKMLKCTDIGGFYIKYN